MPGRRLRLILHPESIDLSLAPGEAVSVRATVDVSDIEGGEVQIHLDSPHVSLLSAESAHLLASGTYSREFEWSIGTVEFPSTLKSSVALVTVIAMANGLRQKAQRSVRLR